MKTEIPYEIKEGCEAELNEMLKGTDYFYSEEGEYLGNDSGGCYMPYGSILYFDDKGDFLGF